MVITQSNKLAAPKICILRVNVRRFFRFTICACVILERSSMYLSFNVRTNWAYDKKRFVYANNISDTAENKKVGVIRVNSSTTVNLNDLCNIKDNTGQMQINLGYYIRNIFPDIKKQF